VKQTVRVRPATKKEAAIIAGFNKAMAHETERRSLSPAILSRGVRAVFSHPRCGFYLVAEIGKKVVGSLMVTSEWSDWRNGAFWWIQSVYVPPAFRRRGVYRALHEAVKILAQKKRRPKVCGLRLYVDCGNASAQSAYGTMGMKKTGYIVFEEEFYKGTS
jgi:GNAT superfamily N-acetyltransferase